MKNLSVIAGVIISFNALSFEIHKDVVVVSQPESAQAKRIMEGAEQPSTLAGLAVKEFFSCKNPNGCSADNTGSLVCTNLKNDALKAYCLRGESECREFGFARNRDKFGIPRWVEEFCRSNYSIPDKALEDYYRYGYTSKFKGNTYDSARKYGGDMASRKRWIIYYANGVLLKHY